MISVQKLIQFLCKNNHDLTKDAKISEALEYVKLPSRANLLIDPNEFTFERFFRFYMKLMDRQEVERLFESLQQSKNDKQQQFLSWEAMKTFLQSQNDTTNDPLELDYYEEKAKMIIEKYNKSNSSSFSTIKRKMLMFSLRNDQRIISSIFIELR